MDENRWNGLGRLTKNPVFHEAGRRGDEHVTFTLAINRVVPDEGGPRADYAPCVLWGPEARVFCESRQIGDEVLVRGPIRTNMVHLAGGGVDFRWEIRVEEIKYGRESLKNLAGRPQSTAATRAVGHLTNEFGGSSGG